MSCFFPSSVVKTKVQDQDVAKINSSLKEVKAELRSSPNESKDESRIETEKLLSEAKSLPQLVGFIHVLFQFLEEGIISCQTSSKQTFGPRLQHQIKLD